MARGYKQARGEKTKKEILEVALQLFSESGYTKVTVEDIVKKSKTSKGSFYAHFGSKYEIFLEKFKEIDGFYESRVKEIPTHIPAKDKIVLFIKEQMTFIATELGLDLMRVIYSNALTNNPHDYFLDHRRPLFLILRNFVEESINNGELNEDLTSDEIIRIINSAMFGVIYQWSMSNAGFKLADESEKLFKTIVKGL
ncbi:TetR/AcrR family transcriptional regulator [Salicibibacter kimchii]|uniref:TetR/AcrR family transcriptional regulator n=1 Tax=Salicibibacter kimchii TaxID=2099786 RepID=UPI00135C7A84|nr:TetR/AcrR family transcriptional regulator [Salicibibacter kimchii]